MAIFFRKQDFVTDYSFPKKNHKMVKIRPQQSLLFKKINKIRKEGQNFCNSQKGFAQI